MIAGMAWLYHEAKNAPEFDEDAALYGVDRYSPKPRPYDARTHTVAGGGVGR